MRVKFSSPRTTQNVNFTANWQAHSFECITGKTVQFAETLVSNGELN